MRVTVRSIAFMLVVTMIGGVLLLSLSGLWKTTSSKTPVKFSTGEFAGLSNPADIRGSYSFSDVEKNFSVTAEMLAKAFSFDTSSKPAGTYVAKDIEGAYGALVPEGGEVGTDSLKWFVSLYMGIPYEAEGDTWLPTSALDLLFREGKIDAAAREELASRSVEPPGEGLKSPVVITEHVESAEDGVIKGSTTYADVIAWGVSQQQIEEIIGMPLPGKTTNIRDHLQKNGLSFSTVKAQLQSLVDVSGQ